MKKFFYTLVCFVIVAFQTNLTHAQTQSFATGNWHTLENIKKAYLGKTNALLNCDSSKKGLLEMVNTVNVQHGLGYDLFTEQDLPYLLSELEESHFEKSEGDIYQSILSPNESVVYILHTTHFDRNGDSEKFFSFTARNGVKLFTISSYDMSLVFQNVKKQEQIQAQSLQQISPSRTDVSGERNSYYGNQNPYNEPVRVVYRSNPNTYSGVSFLSFGFGYRQPCRSAYYQQNYCQPRPRNCSFGADRARVSYSGGRSRSR